MIKVLITGGSGFVGTHLTKMLKEKGYHVEHLARSRNSKAGVRTWLWDIHKNYIEEGALDKTGYEALYLIHLAGEGIIDKKWTPERKKAIVNSRVKTISFLYKQFQQRGFMPDAVISAGGSAYYGLTTSGRIFTETDVHGEGFAAHCCVEWEAAARLFEKDCPVSILRIPMVLDKNEGGFPKMIAPLRFGVKAVVGTGNQWLPFVHINDLCRAFVFAMEHSLNGTYNVVAPTHVTFRGMLNHASAVIHRSFLTVKVPNWAVKFIYGERYTLVTEGSRIGSDAIQQQGFTFDFSDPRKALEDLYR